MTHAVVSGNLSNADLSSAGLLGALMGSSNLTSADLAGADALGTDLSGAVLKDANLQGIDLDEAGLEYADLLGATGTPSGDAGAVWTDAVCPTGGSAAYYTAGCFSAVAVSTPAATPVITSGTAGDNGWYTSGVTVTWYWVDSQSLVPASCPATTSDADQGAAVAVSGSCTDSAGHTGTASVTVPIDTTPPVVALTGMRDGATYPLGDAPLPACTTSDALSGVADNAVTSILGGRSDGSPVAAACRWHSSGQYLGCPIPTPRHVRTGHQHTYTITVTENLGTGFVTAPPDAYSQNPEPVYFR